MPVTTKLLLIVGVDVVVVIVPIGAAVADDVVNFVAVFAVGGGAAEAADNVSQGSQYWCLIEL